MKTVDVPAHKHLDRVLADIPKWAADNDLVALCEMPEPERAGLTVWTGGRTTAAEFVALATRARARLLYYAADHFDAAEFLDWAAESDIPEIETECDALADSDPAFDRLLRALRDHARSHDGDLAAVGMCFVADGVAHYWAARRPWLANLEMDQAQLQELMDLSRDNRRQDDLARSDAELARIAAELQVRADFRRAPSRLIQRGIALAAFPAPAGEERDVRRHERMVDTAVWQACEALESEALDLYTAAENNWQALIDDILTAGVLTDATTVSVRKIKVTDFLLKRFDGHQPPRRFLELLVNDPQIKASARRTRAVPAAHEQQALA